MTVKCTALSPPPNKHKCVSYQKVPVVTKYVLSNNGC